MSEAYFAISTAYAVFSVALGALEFYRIRASGPDAITVFIVIFVLQCCLPGIGIYAALPLSFAAEPTGNNVFDGIFQRLNVTTAFVVLELTIWFAVFFYVGASGGRIILQRLFPRLVAASLRLEGVEYRLLLFLFGGLALTVISFVLLGDDIVDSYSKLIRLRAYADDVERTGLSAYAFELTQAWGWLSVPALFAISEKRRRGLIWFACLICAALFAVLGASRRAIFIPIMLCYFTVLIYDGRWRARLLVAIAIPTLVLIAFGKEFLSTIAFGGAVADVTSRYDSTVSAILRASSEQGITIVESLGTLTFLDDRLRLGVDHLLSIAQRFPHRQLGFNIDFPTRIVRISTEAFASPDNQDIPPGLLGQMWLDFRVLGPVAWGILMGAQTSVAQFFYERCQRNLQSSSLVALVVFLIALPINTGSYDFTFSVDVIATVAALVLAYRVRRIIPASKKT